MITEPNALQTLIAPPSIANRMANFVLGVSAAVPSPSSMQHSA